MTASELFKAGRLADALQAQIADVKAHPTDTSKRLFLFELSLFVGDLQRAQRQGDLVVYPEPEINATMDCYRLLTAHEQSRRDVFVRGTPPKSFGPLPEECAKRIEAISLLRSDRAGEAASLLARHPPVLRRCTLNGTEYEGICDCDDLLAPILEVSTHQGYFWVPLSQVRSLKMNAPKYPRDLYWAPAQLELIDGQNGPVFLQALYPFSHEHAEEEVRLGRKTDWTGGEGVPVRGMGLKTFLAGDDVVGLLDIRELTFHS
jgi:type VI secretion system protein ImpE